MEGDEKGGLLGEVYGGVDWLKWGVRDSKCVCGRSVGLGIPVECRGVGVGWGRDQEAIAYQVNG